MKKITLLLLLFTLTVSPFYFNEETYITNNADSYTVVNSNEFVERIDLPDGSYIIITLDSSSNVLLNNSIFSNTKNGTKTAVGHGINGKVLWEFTINATFNLNYGISATATSSSYTYVIKNKQWHFSDGWSDYSSNMAEAKGVMKHKLLLITLKNINIHLTLTSDVYGNIT